MIKFETPIQFDILKQNDNLVIEYSNLMEISQGGPEVGTISINKKNIQKYRFGGPCLIFKKFIFAPIYINSFFNSGFKLSIINSENLSVVLIGKIQDLIFLDSVEEEKIHYFKDYEKSESSSFEIDKYIK